MTLKRYSVILDFCSFPCTLSKFFVINVARHSQCACAQSEFLNYLLSQQPMVQIRPNFVCRQTMTRQLFLIIRPRSYDVIMTMQISSIIKALSVNLKVKVTFKTYSVVWTFVHTHVPCLNMPLQISQDTYTAHAHKLNFSLSYISVTTDPNSSKFCLEIHHDKTIISYKKNKII